MKVTHIHYRAVSTQQILQQGALSTEQSRFGGPGKQARNPLVWVRALGRRCGRQNLYEGPRLLDVISGSPLLCRLETWLLQSLSGHTAIVCWPDVGQHGHHHVVTGKYAAADNENLHSD